ncbi:MAG: LamG-like jellyroll fold domain-containing protein [Patescibacteria group bacterium]
MKEMNIFKNSFGSLINKRYLICLSFLFIFLPSFCLAMPPGSLVYRTSGEGKMFGYSGDPLIYSEKGILKNVYSGHVGIYIGRENGVDYIVEALSGGIVKTPAEKFVNLAEGEKYLGAKIPKGLNATQQAKAVSIAKSLVGKNLAYDYDFKNQKGPESGQWTCVGLTEKIYESANISNPNNLSSLEYDKNFYALNITPDGFDNYSVVNDNGDCFSRDLEFSKINRRTDMIIPAPEIIGYNIGLERNGERYIFLPYTQYVQPSLDNVKTDITISSSFSGPEVRGSINTTGLALRWSLINNPISSVKILAQKASTAIASVTNKIFGSSKEESKIVLTEVASELSPELADAIKVGAVVTKAVKENVSTLKSAGTKKTSTKTDGNLKAAGNNSNSSSWVSPAIVNKAVVSVNTAVAAKSSSSAKTLISDTIKPASTLKSSSSLTYYTPIKTAASATVNNGARIGASGSWVSSGASSSSGSSGSSGSGSGASGGSIVDNTAKIATINKIYSTGSDDYIELYNPGDKDFDLSTAGYRIERAKTAEDPSLIMRIGDTDDGSYPGGTIIKAKGKYLIVKNTASNYYLAKADAIAVREEFAWPGSGYTLYLGTGAISSSKDVDIVEAIGFGPDATYFQGEAPAQEIKDNYVLNRIKDTKNNNLDFNLIKSDDPSISWASLNSENLATSTNNVSTSTNNISTSTNNVSTSTNNTSTTTGNISTSTDGVSTSTDNISTSSSFALINKIYGTGNNDWLELLNPGEIDFDLSLAEYRLEKSKTALDPALIMRIGDPLDGSYPGGTIIKAGGKYLIASSDANDYYINKADAIATRTDFSWLNSGYSIYLANGPVSSNTDSNIIDLVGFGSDSLYFKGLAPASELNDNYILNRIGSTGNNNFDFNLIKSDDPNINWDTSLPAVDPGSKIYNFSASAYNLFPQPIPIDSSGLIYLWHFNDCSGDIVNGSIGGTNLTTSGRWVAGKYNCAKENGYARGKTSATLNSEIDINNFSLSFWIKKTDVYARLNLIMAGASGDSVNMTFDNGELRLSGLAIADWRNAFDFSFSDTWQLVTLVVSRNEGYWTLYIDGQEKIHVDTYKLLAPMNYLEFAGDNGAYAIDELAIWNRALSKQEILDIKTAEQQFKPLVIPSPQEKPILKHFWNFNEGIGNKSIDLIASTSMTMKNNNWNNKDLTNSALYMVCGENIKVDFPEIKSKDVSLTFLWRRPNPGEDTRVRVALGGVRNNNIFTLTPSCSRPAYNFNGGGDYFNIYSNPLIPCDYNTHQLALVYDSYRYQLNFYVDGVLKDTKEHIWSLNKEAITSLEISPENGGSEIDDIGIWEGVLSGAQIQEIFANN